MATRKAGGTAKNLRDSNPKYLGTKLYDGEVAKPGAIIIRQRGSRILPGVGVKAGKDYTLFAVTDGTVKFRTMRKTHFNGKSMIKRVVDVVAK